MAAVAMNIDSITSPSCFGSSPPGSCFSRGVFGGTLDDGSDFYVTFSQESEVVCDRLDVHHSSIDEIPAEAIPTSVTVLSSETFFKNDTTISSSVVSAKDHSVGFPEGTQSTNGDCDDVCWVGATFEALDSCERFFQDYSVSRGYKIFRNRNRKRKVDGTLYYQEFMCSYAGVSRRKVGGSSENDIFVPNGMMERRRVDKKSMCPALICCKLTSEDCWTCVTHKVQHSHPFIDARQRYLLRSGKFVNKDLFQAIFDLMCSGVRPSEAIRILGNTVGGIEALGLTRRMVYNQVTAEKKATLGCGDAKLLLETFRERVQKEPNFFFEMLVDKNNRMSSFLWCDEVMRSDYAVFGDVVVFDTTFRTNKYNMFCAPFIGIDNHKQNLVFAIAFLVGQKKEDFIWCFECFLRAMNGKMPKTVMTDQDLAIAYAVDRVFVGSLHRLCLWHICENAKKNLKGLMNVDGFSKLFYKCLYYCMTVEEFELQWEKMISSFGQQSNTWLSNLYTLRNKWCPVFCNHIFSAGIRSSQRSESTNSVLTSMANCQMGMYAVFTAVEKMVNEWRNKRISEDFMNVGVINLKTKDSRLLIDASRIYTRAILEEFETELVKGVFGKYRVLEVNSDFASYEVSAGLSDSHKFVVKYAFISGSVSCSCMLFEERGILCSHSLRILNILNVQEVPRDSILHRWTKEARLVYDNNGKYTYQDAFSCFAWRNSIMNRYLNIVLVCQRDEKCRSILEKSLSALEEDLRAVGSVCSNSSISISSSRAVEDVQLGNPKFVSSNIYRSKHGKTSRGGGQTRCGGVRSCGQGDKV